MPRAMLALFMTVGSALSGPSCRRGPERALAPLSSDARGPRGDAGAIRLEDMPRLPEDEEAGKRSQAQWRDHLEHEEVERQLAYDRSRLEQHRALVGRLVAARAQFDRARTAAAVRRIGDTMPATVGAGRARLEKLDHWGGSSRLLGDYTALLTLLDGPYSRARAAALRGDGGELAQLRATWDRHLATITDWLAKVAQAEGDDGDDRAPAPRGAPPAPAPRRDPP